MTNAQEWLNNNYPKEERSEKTSLVAADNKIEGELDLSEFMNLEEIYFFNTGLTSTNFLKTIPNPEKLLYLDLRNNNFDQQNLSIFENFINLKKLNLGNNRFEGSLNSLKNINELEELDISNTDIDGDWWYLPDKLTKFNYSSEEKPNEKLASIEADLEHYLEDWGIDLVGAKHNFWATNGLKKEEELKDEVVSLQLQLAKKEADIALLGEKINKIIGTSAGLLIDLSKIDSEKKELNEKIAGLTEKLEKKEEELKKANENNEQTLRVRELEKEIEELKKQLVNEKEKLQKLEKKEEKITELARLKVELMGLKYEFLGKVDKMKSLGDRKLKIKSDLDKFLKAISDLIYDNKNISAKKEEEEAHGYLKITGLQIDLNILSNKQKKIANEEIRLEWINISREFVDQKLINQWTGNGFTYQQVKEWTETLGSEFNPNEDDKFVNWLVNIKQGDYANPEWVSENLAQLRSEYQARQEAPR